MARTGIQLCYPFEESRLMKWRPPYFVQPKLDGDRCRAIITDDGSVTLLSSEENIITGVPHINMALERLNLHDVELDGELYTHGMNHELVHGIASRSRNLHSRYDDLEFHVFDIVNGEPQVHRTATLFNHLYPRFRSPLVMVRTIFAYSLDDVLNAYDTILEQGYEGIVVRDHEAPYIRRRSTQVMKFKPKKDDLYVICGYSPEVDQFHNIKPGVLGRFIVAGSETTPVMIGEYPPIIDPPKGYFAVGSSRKGTGNKFQEQKDLWQKREILPGKIIRVAYQHITSGKGVPRFPVFVELIWDLTDVNQQKID